MFDRVVHMAHLYMDKFELGSASWGQQFVEAMNVNGGDVENATTMDYLMHFATFFWKVYCRGAFFFVFVFFVDVLLQNFKKVFISVLLKNRIAQMPYFPLQ